MELIREIAAKADSLPPMPGVAQKVLAVLSDPEFDIQELMNVLCMDQAVTARVLRMANSPYYGLCRRVSSLEQALGYLGSDRILEMVLTGGAVGMYAQDQKGYRMEQGELWRHSLATALLAAKLGKRFKHPQVGCLYTAALLHDVGKLALSEFVDQYLPRIREMVDNRGIDFLSAERAVLGIDHALLGARLAQRWDFPGEIVEAIAFHHDYTKSKKARRTTRLIHLANLLVLSVGPGAGAMGLAIKAHEEILVELGLRSRDLDHLILDVVDILEKASDMLAAAEPMAEGGK